MVSKAIEPQIRKTMERLPDLVHPGTGAVSQVSLKPDWSAPAPEFPMFAQEAALKAFAQAYALWGDPRFKTAGARIARDRCSSGTGRHSVRQAMTNRSPMRSQPHRTTEAAAHPKPPNGARQCSAGTQ